MAQIVRGGATVAGTELGKAYVQIVPSARGIKSELTKSLGGEADSAGTSFGSSMVGKIKSVIATAAIGKALSATISEGAALEQSIGGIETLFKGSAEKVKQNAAEAYRTAGMSANQYMELTTGFAAGLLQSLGGDTEKAAKISDMAMTDMSDNANKMGTDMERITDAYQGFAKQNYTMLDNLKLGYGGTKTEMERLLTDAQKITGIKYDINNLSDVYEAIHVIQGELDITGTTALEASTTISGSFSSMKAAFKNVLGRLTLGQDVKPALRALSTTVTTFLIGNFLPAVGNILSALPGAIATFLVAAAPQLASGLMGLLSQAATGIRESLPQLLISVQTLVDQMSTTIQMRLPEFLDKGVQAVAELINGILQNLPQLITTAGNLVISFVNGINPVPILNAGANLVMEMVNGIINNFPQIVSSAANTIAKFVSTVGQNLPQILQSGIEIIGKLAAGLIKAIPTLVGKIPQIITSIKDAFSSIDWGSIGKNIISGIANGLAGAAGAIVTAAKDAAKKALDAAKDFLGIHSPSRVFEQEVGAMIPPGMANGVIKNIAPLSEAIEKARNMIVRPFEYDELKIRTSEYKMNDSQYTTLAKIDRLLELLERKKNVEEIKLYLGDREVMRWLREKGVLLA